MRGFVRKFVQKIQFSLKSDKNDGVIYMMTNFPFMLLFQWIVMRNISDKSCRENQNTYFGVIIFFPSRKSYLLWDTVIKYGTVGLATDENMAHALSMPDN